MANIVWTDIYLQLASLMAAAAFGIEMEREGWAKAAFYATAAIVFAIGARS